MIAGGGWAVIKELKGITTCPLSSRDWPRSAMQAVKLDIVIPANHQVELALPESLPAGPAEVIVLAPSAEPVRICHRGGMGMDVGKGWVADDFDAPLPEDLQSLFEGRA
jgi:hypothetical protein